MPHWGVREGKQNPKRTFGKHRERLVKRIAFREIIRNVGQKCMNLRNLRQCRQIVSSHWRPPLKWVMQGDVMLI